MSTSSFDSLYGKVLTQQYFGISTATKSNEDKPLETSKLMIETDIRLHTDYLIAVIESSEDIETLEDIMSERHCLLKIDIKWPLTLHQIHVKEKKTPFSKPYLVEYPGITVRT